MCRHQQHALDADVVDEVVGDDRVGHVERVQRRYEAGRADLVATDVVLFCKELAGRYSGFACPAVYLGGKCVLFTIYFKSRICGTNATF